MPTGHHDTAGTDPKGSKEADGSGAVMLDRVLYASRSREHGPQLAAIIDDIVLRSKHTNDRIDVTGALICTGPHFIHLMEGPRPAIDMLMARILSDPRHFNIRILQQTQTAERLFPGWPKAFMGPSRETERLGEFAEKAIDATEPRERQAYLEQILHEFIRLRDELLPRSA